MEGNASSIVTTEERENSGGFGVWASSIDSASRWPAASVVLGGGLLLDEGADRQRAFVLNVRVRVANLLSF